MKRSALSSRSAPPKARNPKRKAREFERCYGSTARVAFVKSLPCIVCGRGPCDNAHIRGDGAGRKADYTAIVPLCCMPMDDPWNPGYHRGHHGLFHKIGVESFVALYQTRRRGLDLEAEAAKTEAAWLYFLSIGGDCTEQDHSFTEDDSA